MQWVCGAIACSANAATASNWGCFDRGLSVFVTSADGANSPGAALPSYILPRTTLGFNLTNDAQDSAASATSRSFYNRPTFSAASVELPFTPQTASPAGSNWRLYMGEDLFDDQVDDNSGCTCAFVHYRLAPGERCDRARPWGAMASAASMLLACYSSC